MNTFTRTVTGVALAVTTLGSAAAFAAPNENASPRAPGQQRQQGHGRFGKGGPMHGQMGGPLEHLGQHAASIDFAALGVSKPAFWDSMAAWLKTDDAKKVGKYMAENRLKPTPGEPGSVLAQVDFAKAGVSKPAFWDDLITWMKTDDAKKVLVAKMGMRMEQRFENLSTEFSAVDFTKAGIAKPAFWGDLVTWLKSDDASKLAGYLMQNRVKQGPPSAPTT